MLKLLVTLPSGKGDIVIKRPHGYQYRAVKGTILGVLLRVSKLEHVQTYANYLNSLSAHLPA